MPRGIRNAESQLTKLEAQKAVYLAKIESYKEKVSDIDTKIKNLSAKNKQKELADLLDTIKASGKTPEEVLAALKG